MTFDEYRMKMDNVIQALQTEPYGALMVEIASDALALIRQRIIQTGQTAEGGQYPPYSIKPLYTGCKAFINQSKCPAGSKSKRRELKWITINRGGKPVHLFRVEGGYKEFREMNDRQTGFVDFSFSGRMWVNIKIKSTFDEHQNGVARIGATQQENIDKLAGNTARKGDILKLSDKEITDIISTYNLGIEQIFTKNGL